MCATSLSREGSRVLITKGGSSLSSVLFFQSIHGWKAASQGYPRTISSSPRSVIRKCISCLLSPTCTSRFTHSWIVPDLLWVPLIFQMVLGFLSLNFPILSLFRSLMQMKLLVAPESMRTCLLVIKCKDFQRVGICSDLYLLTNTFFNSNFSRCAHTNKVAFFKNPHQERPKSQFVLPKPCGQYLLFLLSGGFDPYGPKYLLQSFHNRFLHQRFHHQWRLLGSL